jgi:asparagine synthetase B (glutamine-hydrolysing)
MAANRVARFRGPNVTSIVEEETQEGVHLTFLHNLLDISGTSYSQPNVVGEPGARRWALFNGEIYNYRQFADVACDTGSILPAFQSHGLKLGAELDGEFAIAIYDESKATLTICVDPFLTKPLYMGTRPPSADFAVATCQSALVGLGFENVQMCEPNSAYSVAFSAIGTSVTAHAPIVRFDLRQHKNSYDDWCHAFMRAVGKRASHGSVAPCVFMSSGYDSGGICLALNLQKAPYETFSIGAGESAKVIAERIRINRRASCTAAHLLKGISSTEANQIQTDIRLNVEWFRYHHEDAPGRVADLHNDSGAIGAHQLARLAREMGRLVNLSGSGADEILSDYGHDGRKIFHHSEFGGKFPEDLASLFPWKKFYGDSQRSYLFKDEFILGRHGVEGRYPYLDKECVQEFLWLSASLKNHTYKAPLEHFLRSHGYPIEPGVKRGFGHQAQHSLVKRAIGRLRTLIGYQP